MDNTTFTYKGAGIEITVTGEDSTLVKDILASVTSLLLSERYEEESPEEDTNHYGSEWAADENQQEDALPPAAEVKSAPALVQRAEPTPQADASGRPTLFSQLTDAQRRRLVTAFGNAGITIGRGQYAVRDLIQQQYGQQWGDDISAVISAANGRGLRELATAIAQIAWGE